MKMKQITESQLVNFIYNGIKNKLNEAMLKDDGVVSFIMTKQYRGYIDDACLLLAWKGVGFDLKVGGMEYKTAMHEVEKYRNKKEDALLRSKGDPASALKSFKAAYPNKEIISAMPEYARIRKMFIEDGPEFVNKFLGSKTSSSKQMEKEAGMALLGISDDSYLNQFNIKHGAVFCVRDFIRWDEMGRPELADRGKKAKDGEIRGSEFGGIVRGSDDIGGEPDVEAPDTEESGDVRDFLDQILASDNIDLDKLEQMYGVKKKHVMMYKGSTGDEKKQDRIYEIMLSALKKGLEFQDMIEKQNGRLA